MSRADSPTAVDREWRFKPERTHRIPSTWADNARHEVPDDGQERYYAVQIKLGVSLQWGVDDTGSIVDGPHRDKPTVRACYVDRDGCRAYVRDWDAVLDGDGKATPERDFASVLTIDPDDADPVDDHSDRVFYRAVLQDRYDVTPVVADGGQSTGGTEHFPLSPARNNSARTCELHRTSDSGLPEHITQCGCDNHDGVCDVCGYKITVGPSGTEYGHARATNGAVHRDGQRLDCDHRPASCNPGEDRSPDAYSRSEPTQYPVADGGRSVHTATDREGSQ